MSAVDSLAAARRDRVLAAMRDRGIDALILGRQDDTNYAAGMRRLWTAGTRPFGAGCVVVASTGRTHVLSSWDAGLPPTMTFDDLYPLTWNPAHMGEAMTRIEGLGEATRIGVDEVSPSFARAAARFAPHAAVVPADDLMAEVRRTKLPAEIDRIRAACAVAWVGIDAALDDPDAAAAEGVAIAAMAAAGTTVPSSEPVVRRDGDATVIDLGVLLDGYEGGVGGSFVRGARGETPALVDACRVGVTGADLATAAKGRWRVRGLGMGYERPVIDAELGRAETLTAGMVLSVSDGDHRDVVAVTDDGPEVLSTRPS